MSPRYAAQESEYHSLLLAHRVVSRRRSNSVAFGAKRTFREPRQNRIYEYAP
jgi:hypothetical protein